MTSPSLDLWRSQSGAENNSSFNTIKVTAATTSKLQLHPQTRAVFKEAHELIKTVPLSPHLTALSENILHAPSEDMTMHNGDKKDWHTLLSCMFVVISLKLSDAKLFGDETWAICVMCGGLYLKLNLEEQCFVLNPVVHTVRHLLHFFHRIFTCARCFKLRGAGLKYVIAGVDVEPWNHKDILERKFSILLLEYHSNSYFAHLPAVPAPH